MNKMRKIGKIFSVSHKILGILFVLIFPTTTQDANFALGSTKYTRLGAIFDTAIDEIDTSGLHKSTPPIKCKPEELRCKNGESCIPMNNFQDGIRDCADGSDEVCYNWQFDCGWGSPKCIMTDQIKDGRIDCQSGIDEDCGLNDFMCHDKKYCVSLDKYQDGKSDCFDGSDETCRFNQFECKSKKACISMSQFQNGVPNCPDGSDEECFNNEFKCPKGGLPVCIDQKLLNDGKTDCANGEDEGKSGAAPLSNIKNSIGKRENAAKNLNQRVSPNETIFKKGRNQAKGFANMNKTSRVSNVLNTETYIGPSLLGESLTPGIDLPLCNLNNQGFECAPKAVCKIGDEGIPECKCHSHSIFDRSLKRCLSVTEYPLVLKILKRNDKYIRFIDSFVDPSSNEFVEMRELGVNGLKQVLAKSAIVDKVQQVKFNHIIGNLYSNENSKPGIRVNFTLYVAKELDEQSYSVHNEIFRALAKSNFTLGNTNLSVEPFAKKVRDLSPVQEAECKPCGFHSSCKIIRNIPTCTCDNGYYKAPILKSSNETKCVESVAISISLRFLRNGYLSLDYEKLTILNNNENIVSLKEEAIKGMNELFSQSDVGHIYLGSEIIDIKQASLYNADWQSTIVLQFYLHFRKKQTDVKQSQIYRIIYNHFRTTKSRLGHSSHLYADINSIPNLPINSAIYGLKTGSFLGQGECHLDSNQGCGKNSDCRVSKGIIKCLCRIGYHTIQQTKDCTEFQVQNVILLVKKTQNYNKEAFKDLDDQTYQDIGNKIYDDDDFISVITPKMKTILKDPRYNPLFIDMDVKSLGPSVMNNAALNVTLYLRSKEKSTKKRDLDSMIIELLKDGINRVDNQIIQKSEPGIYLNDTSYIYRQNRGRYIVHNNIINFGARVELMDDQQLGFNAVTSFSSVCDLRDNAGCQPNAVCKFVKGELGCFCNRGFYLWKQFGKCIAYRTFNLLLWVIRKDGEALTYEDYINSDFKTELSDMISLAKAGVDYTFQFSNFRPFYLDSIVDGFSDPKTINEQWDRGIALNVTILVVNSYPGNLDDVYDELRQALVSSNGELGSTRLIVHTNSLFPSQPQGSALLGAEGKGLDYARYDVCKQQNNLGCGENSHCTKVSGYARCVCFPGFYLKPGTDRCVAPNNFIMYVRGLRKWVRPSINQAEIGDKTSKSFQELAKNLQSHMSEILKNSSIKNYFLNSEVNSITNLPSDKSSVSSGIFNFTIYITKDYQGSESDIYEEFIKTVELLPSPAVNGTHFVIDTNFQGKHALLEQDGKVQWNYKEGWKKLVTSIRVVSSHLTEYPLQYNKIYGSKRRNFGWEDVLYGSFIEGVNELLIKSVLEKKNFFIQIENITDPQLYQKKWKDGIIVSFSISVRKDNNERVWDQLLSQLYEVDGKLPGTNIRLDLASFQCCNDFVDSEQRLSRAILKVSDQINTKSVMVFAEAEVTLIQLNPEVYHIKYDFITEKIEKRERNIYSKAHINQIHEKIYSIFNNALTDKNIKTDGLGAMKFNFTIDFELNLNFGPENYIYNGNNVSDNLITVIKNAKSGTFLVMNPETLRCCAQGVRGGKRYNVIIKFKPILDSPKDHYNDADLKVIKENFLSKIERVSTQAGLAKYLRAKELVAIYNEYQEDISSPDATRFSPDHDLVAKGSKGYGLIGIFVIVISEEYPFSGYKLLVNLNDHLKGQNSNPLPPRANLNSAIKRYEEGGSVVPLDFEILLPRWNGNAIYLTEEIQIPTALPSSKASSVLPLSRTISFLTTVVPTTLSSSTAYTQATIAYDIENKTESDTKKYSILLRIARYKSVPLVYKQSYKNVRSNDYLNLKKLAEKALDEAYGYSNLNRVYVSSEIQNIQDASDINPDWTNSILLNFTAGFKREYMGAQEEVFKSLINSIIHTGFRVGSSDLYVIAEGEGKAGKNGTSHLAKSQEIVAKVEFQSVKSSRNRQYIVQKSENSKLFVNDQAYLECDEGQKVLVKCDDPLTRCLVKVGFFKKFGPECVCSHGFTRREWINNVQQQPSGNAGGIDENAQLCLEYRSVGIALKISGIEFRNLHSGRVQLFPNTVEYKRLTSLIMRELTSIFVKSPYRKSFLRLEIRNMTEDVIDDGFKPIPALIVESLVFFDSRLPQSEEVIRKRLTIEIALYKRNLDKIGMAIEVIEPNVLTDNGGFLRPVFSRTTKTTTTQTTTQISTTLRTTKPATPPTPPARKTPLQSSTRKISYEQEYFGKTNLNSLQNIRSFMDLTENRILEKKELKSAEEIVAPATTIKSPFDFLKVSDNKLQEVICEIGTAIGCSSNEECILNNARAICRCLFGYAKEANTTTCIAHKTVDVQIRLDSIKNVSMLDLYKGGLIDRKNSNFVHFIMDELDDFVGESQYSKYIIETRFNNLAKIHYEKDPLAQHILLNFTVMIKKTFEGTTHEIVSSLISRIRDLKFKLDGKALASASAFKDLASVIQTEDFNFIPGETFETLELQGAACSYEETLICAQNKELCKVINGKPVCLCRYGFARPSNTTKLTGSCTPSFYYFIVVRIIREKDRILNIETIENGLEKDKFLSNFEKLGKQALDYTVISSDLKDFFLNSKFNGITNPKTIDERWKDLGVGLNFTLVLSQNYRGTTRNIAKSLSTIIIKNGYKLPLTDYYVIPLVSPLPAEPVVKADDDIEKYLVQNNIKYTAYEIILQPLATSEPQIISSVDLKQTLEQINQDVRSSKLKDFYLGIKLRNYDGAVEDGAIKRYIVAIYFRKSLPYTLTSVKEIIQISIGHKFSLFLKNIPNQRQQNLGLIDLNHFSGRERQSGYLYALEIDIDQEFDYRSFSPESPLYRNIANNFSTAINKIFSKTPLKSGYYQGIKINAIFPRESSTIERSAMVNFTIYVSKLHDASFEEISTSILREIANSNYELDTGYSKIKVKPESLNTYNIGAVSFVVLLSVLRQGNNPLVYNDGLYDKASIGYKKFEQTFIEGVKEVLKGSDMEKYLIGADVNSISQVPAPIDAEAIVNLGVVVNFTLHFTPIFKVSDDQAKVILTKLISQRNYQLGQTDLYISPIPLPPLAQSICLTEPAKGPCTGNFTRWYFDSNTKRCQDFFYSGCQGNDNNFLSLTQCLSSCMFYMPRCTLPLDTGLCSQKVIRFYYDESISQCRNFVYTGCGGNFNNFKDWKSCNDYCDQQHTSKRIVPTSTPGPAIYIIHNRPNAKLTTAKTRILGTKVQSFVFPIAQRYETKAPNLSSENLRTRTRKGDLQVNLTSWLGLNPQNEDSGFNPFFETFNPDDRKGSLPKSDGRDIYAYHHNRQFQQDFKAETIPILSASPKDEILGAPRGQIKDSRSNQLDIDVFEENGYLYDAKPMPNSPIIKASREWVKEFDGGDIKEPRSPTQIEPKNVDENRKVDENLEDRVIAVENDIERIKPEVIVSYSLRKSSVCADVEPANATCDQLSLCFPNELFQKLCGCNKGGEKKKFSEMKCEATSQYIFYQPMKNVTETEVPGANDESGEMPKFQEVSKIFRKEVHETIKNSTLDNYFIGSRVNGFINNSLSQNDGFIVNYTIFMKKNYPGNESDLKAQLEMALRDKLKQTWLETESFNKAQRALLRLNLERDSSQESLKKEPEIKPPKTRTKSFLISERVENKYLTQGKVVNIGPQIIPSQSKPPPVQSEKDSSPKMCPKHFIIYQAVRRNNTNHILYTTDLDDILSEQYQKLVKVAENGLDKAFTTTSVSSYFLNTMVGKFIRGSGDSVIMKVLVCLDKGYQGTSDDITNALTHSIKSGNNRIGKSSLYTDDVLSYGNNGVNSLRGVDDLSTAKTPSPGFYNNVNEGQSNNNYIKDTISLINLENTGKRREHYESEVELSTLTTESTTSTTVLPLSVSFIRQTISPFSHIDYRVSLGDKAPLNQTMLFEIDLRKSGINNVLNTNDITNEFNRGLEKVIDKLGLTEYFIKNSVNSILTPQQLSNLGLLGNHDSLLVNATISWDGQIKKTKVGRHKLIKNILCQIRNQINHEIESSGYALGDTSLKISPGPIGSMPFIMYLAVPFNISSFPLLTNVRELNAQTLEYDRFRKTLDIGLYQLYFPRKIFNPSNGGNAYVNELNYCPEEYSDQKESSNEPFYLGNRLNGINIKKGRGGIALFILNFTIFVELNSGSDYNSVRMDLLNRIDSYDGYLGRTGLKLFLTNDRALKRIQGDTSIGERVIPTLKGTQEESFLLPVVSISGRPLSYTISYANPDSEEYLNLDKEFKHYIDELFLSSPLRGVYQGVQINAIKPLSALYNTNVGHENGVLINYTVIIYNDGNNNIQPPLSLQTEITHLVDASFTPIDPKSGNTENSGARSALDNKVECLASQKLCRPVVQEAPVGTTQRVPSFIEPSTAPESAGHVDIGQNGYKTSEETALAYPLQLTLYKYDVSQMPLYWNKEYENQESLSYKILSEGTKKMLDSVFSKAPQLAGRYVGVKVDRLSPYIDEISGKAYIMFDLTVYLVPHSPPSSEDDLSFDSQSQTTDPNNGPGHRGGTQPAASYIDGFGQTGRLTKALYQIIYDNLVSHSPMAVQQTTSWPEYRPTPIVLDASDPIPNNEQGENGYGPTLAQNQGPERYNLVRSSFVENKFAVDATTTLPSTKLLFKQVWGTTLRVEHFTPTSEIANDAQINSGRVREQLNAELRRRPSLREFERAGMPGEREYLVLLNVLRRNHDALLFHPEFSDGNQRSELYSYVVANSRIGLENIIRGSDLANYYISCKVNGILDPEIVNLPSPANGIIVNFTVAFNVRYLGTQENIFNIVSQKLIDSNYNLPGTDLFVDPAPNKVEYELEFNFEETGVFNLSQPTLHQLVNLAQGLPNSDEITNAFQNGIKSVLMKTPLAGYFIDGKIKDIKYDKTGNLTFMLDVLLKPDYPGSKKDLYSAIYNGFEQNTIPLNQNSTIKLARYRKPINLNIGVMRLNDQKLTYIPEYENVNSNEYRALNNIFVDGIKKVISNTHMAGKLRAIKMVDIVPTNHVESQYFTPRHDRFEDFGASNNTSSDLYEIPDPAAKEGGNGFNAIGEGLTINYEADMGKECDFECEEKLRQEISKGIQSNYNQIGDSGLYTEPLINKHLMGDQETINRLTTQFITSNPYNEGIRGSTTTPTILPDSSLTYPTYKERFNRLNCKEADTFTGCGLNQFCEISMEGFRAVCQCFPGYLKSHENGNCIDSRQRNDGYQSYSNTNTRFNIITATPATVFGWNSYPKTQNSCTEKPSNPNGCGKNARCVYRRAIKTYECECISGFKNDLNDCTSEASLITSASIDISPKSSITTKNGPNEFVTFYSTVQAKVHSPSPRTFARYNSYTVIDKSTKPIMTTAGIWGISERLYSSASKSNGDIASPLTRGRGSKLFTTPTYTYSAVDQGTSSPGVARGYESTDNDKEFNPDGAYPDVKLYGSRENESSAASSGIFRIDHTQPLTLTQQPIPVQNSFQLVDKDSHFSPKTSTHKSVLTPDLTIYDNVVKSITYRLTHVANVTGKNSGAKSTGIIRQRQATIVPISRSFITCREDSGMPSGCPPGKKCVVLRKDNQGTRDETMGLNKYAICVCEDGHTPDPTNNKVCIALEGLPEQSTISLPAISTTSVAEECDPQLNSGCNDNEICSVINNIPQCRCLEGSIRLYPSSVCIEYVAIPLYLEVLRQGNDPFYYKSPIIDPSSPRSKELYKKAQLGLNELVERTKVSPFFLGSKLNSIYQIYQDKRINVNHSTSKPRIRTVFNYSLYFSDQKDSSPAPSLTLIKGALEATLLSNKGLLGNSDLYINPKSLNGTGIKLYEIYIHILSKNDRPLQFISAYGDPESWQFKLLANSSELGLKKTLVKGPLNDFLSVVKLTRIYDGQNFKNNWNATSVFKFLIGLLDTYPGNSINISSSLATSIVQTNYTLGSDLNVNPVSVELPRLSVYDYMIKLNTSKLRQAISDDELKMISENGISKLLSATLLGNQYFGSEINGITYLNNTKGFTGTTILNISIYVPTKYKYSYSDVKKILAKAFDSHNFKLGNTAIFIDKINPFATEDLESQEEPISTTSSSPITYYSTTHSTTLFQRFVTERRKIGTTRGDLAFRNKDPKQDFTTITTKRPLLRKDHVEEGYEDEGQAHHTMIVIAPEVKDPNLYKPTERLIFKKTSHFTPTMYRTIPLDDLSTPVTKNNFYHRFLPDRNRPKDIAQRNFSDEESPVDDSKAFNFNQNKLEISESQLSDLCALMSCSNGKVCRIVMGQPTCICKPGFSRKDTGPCFMAKKFSLLVRVLRENDTYLIYSYRYQNTSSREYQNLYNKAKFALEDQVQNTKIYPWFIKAPLVKIDDSKNYPSHFKDTSGYKVPILVYNFDIDSTYNGGPDIIRQELMKSIALNNNSLGNTDLYVDPLPLVHDIDECSDFNLNDCHQLATCINTPGRFTCKCLDGYIDNSIDNFETSGRLCNAPVSDCSEEYCSYHGSCRVDAQQNKRVCDCEAWWVGRQCQHSGKLIAIISGFILCLALLLCCLLPLWLCFQRKRTRRQTENMRWAYDTMSKDTFGMSSNSDKDTNDSTRIIPSLIIPRARLSEAARSQISSKLKDDTFDDILPTSWDDSFMHIPRPIVAEKNYNPQALALVHESDSRSDRSDTQLINEGSLKGFPKAAPVIESSMEAQVKRAREKIASASDFYRARHFDEKDNAEEANEHVRRSEQSSSSYGKMNRNANNSNSVTNDNYSSRYGDASKRGGATGSSSMGHHGHSKDEPTTEITEETTTTVEEWTKRYRKSTAAGAKKTATSTQTDNSQSPCPLVPVKNDKEGKTNAKVMNSNNNGSGSKGMGLSSGSTSSSDYSYYEYKGGDSDDDPKGKGHRDGEKCKPGANYTSCSYSDQNRNGDRNVAIDYYREDNDARPPQPRPQVAATAKVAPRFKRNNSAISNNGGPNANSGASKYYRNHRVNGSNANNPSASNKSSGSNSKPNPGHAIKNFPKRLSSSASDISTASSVTNQARHRMRTDNKTKSDDEMLLNLNDNKEEQMLKDVSTTQSNSNFDNEMVDKISDSSQKRYYFARRTSEYDREEVACMSEVGESRQATYHGIESIPQTEGNFEVGADVISDMLFKGIPIITHESENVTNTDGATNKKSKKKMNQMSIIAAEASHVCKAWQRSGRLKQIVSNSGDGTWSSKGNYPEEVASYSEAEGTVRDRKYVRQNSANSGHQKASKAQSSDPRGLYNMHYPNQHSNVGYESDENYKI